MTMGGRDGTMLRENIVVDILVNGWHSRFFMKGQRLQDRFYRPLLETLARLVLSDILDIPEAMENQY